METRRFTIFYKAERYQTAERAVVGTPEDALKAAWQMLQNGDAAVAAIVEVGNLEFHIWNDAIVRWGMQQRPRAERTAAPASVTPAVARDAA